MQKRCSIVPVSVAVAALSAYGRCEQTVSLLQSVGELPRLWALSLEQEQNRARLEEDLVLNDAIADAEEHDPCHLASELAVMVPFAPSKEDEEVSNSWSLARVPDSLARELASFVKYRQEALNIHRSGAAVVPITCENDTGTCLRFLGYLSTVEGIQPGLGVFAKMDLSQWVSDWINALQERGLKYSSLAVSRTQMTALLIARPSRPRSPCAAGRITQTASYLSHPLCITRTRLTRQYTLSQQHHWLSWYVSGGSARVRPNSRSCLHVPIQTIWSGRRRIERGQRRRVSTASLLDRRSLRCFGIGSFFRFTLSCHRTVSVSSESCV